MPRHLLALALGTLSLGIAEFSMMSILSNVAESLAVSIPEAGHFISAYALGVCAGVAVMVVAARGIALSRMLYILAGLIFAGNLFAALAFDYWSMLAARFIAGLPHGAYFGVGAIVATSLAAPGQASRDVCLMVTGMTIVASQPRRWAERATPWAWLPAEAAMTPRRSSSGERRAILLYAPRSLKEKTGCKSSRLSSTLLPSRRDRLTASSRGVSTATS